MDQGISATLSQFAEQFPPERGEPLSAQEAVALIAALIAHVRPPKGLAAEHQTAHCITTLQALCHALQHEERQRALLRQAILSLLSKRFPITLYVDGGIQPNSGFFSELWRRCWHKLLPADIHPHTLKDQMSNIFTQRGDEIWMQEIPEHVWLDLFRVLALDTLPREATAPCYLAWLDALQILSYRLAASGLEPELVQNHPELEDYTSPFVAQNGEINRYVEHARLTNGEQQALPNQIQALPNQITVLLDQCLTVIQKIRRNTAKTGTSIQLTFLLQRMRQQLARMEHLLELVQHYQANQPFTTTSLLLLQELVYSECHKNDVRMHWRENMEIVALRVTENASRTGEHYITETRSEYFALMRSAMGAGIIIAIMAMIKLSLASLHLAPLTETLLFSLNYGLGFVIIHMLHFTVATKQPAMTAAAIASTIDEATGQNGQKLSRQKKVHSMDNLVNIIAQTTRSQTIAILGNITVAVPIAMLLAWGFYVATGHHFIGVEKAHKLLDDIHPFQSGALAYAAVAGVCLFLSGLIAGYHDNIAVYRHIPARIMALGWLQKLLGPERLARFAHYIENNLGAIAGNFYFGFMLGGMSGLGVMLGLPIDIRHIAFSSAFVGYSFVGLDFQVTTTMIIYAIAGVLLIGTVNLVVSFSLALSVAMKSRKLNYADWGVLVIALLSQLRAHPLQFVLPPKESGLEGENSHH